jgi:phosphate transport system ATP-binding protein
MVFKRTDTENDSSADKSAENSAELSNFIRCSSTEKNGKISVNCDESEVIKTINFSFYYGHVKALENINFTVYKNKITALIGPSGCGKSTLIRSFNRMNDVYEGSHHDGEILFHGKDIFDPTSKVTELRKKIGMIFQKPNPFPMSIYDNVAYGPRTHGVLETNDLDHIVERSLKMAALWDEVQNRLKDSAFTLSGGQQQRLCIARALAIEPEVLLLDEPTSALDPIATGKIEDLMNELKKDFTIVIVTHNMQQAARISDYGGFMFLGKMIEFERTVQLFENPTQELTERYITGRFG